MPGPSKVIVLDPDARASRQVQLGFEREGIPAAAVAVDAFEQQSREVQDDQRERAALERQSREVQDDQRERAALERQSREVQDDQRERAALERPDQDTGLVVVGGSNGRGTELLRRA